MVEQAVFNSTEDFYFHVIVSVQYNMLPEHTFVHVRVYNMIPTEVYCRVEQTKEPRQT